MGKNLSSVFEYVQRIESNVKEIAASVNEHAHMKSIWNIYFLSVVALHETNILCTINLAIVLYGRAHPNPISSFICCHEDTSPEHLIRISRITKRSGHANVTLNFKTGYF